MFIKLQSCLLLLLILIEYVASQRLFDSNERQQGILAAKNELNGVKKRQMLNEVPFRGRQRKNDWWETAHDRLFGQPTLLKPSWNESDNTINRNLEMAQEGFYEPEDRRRVYGGRIRQSSSSSMALIIFMLIVVVSMAVVWMEVDFSIIGVLFRVVSLNDDEDEERAIGRLSTRRAKKSKKKRKLSKSKRNSNADNSDSDSDSDLEARRKSKKKKKRRFKKSHQYRNSEDSV